MDAPALLAVGANLTALYSAAAVPVDLVLKGTAPGEIAVTQPKFEIVVNRETARALGLVLPTTLLERAGAILGR